MTLPCPNFVHGDRVYQRNCDGTATLTCDALATNWLARAAGLCRVSIPFHLSRYRKEFAEQIGGSTSEPRIDAVKLVGRPPVRQVPAGPYRVLPEPPASPWGGPELF
jgi:hypothetical protein